MSEPWYDVVPADAPLSQGDILRSARVLLWKQAAESASLRDWVEERSIDVIVMTQACDLEHRKVANVVLCELIPLSAYRSAIWEARMRQRNQAPTERAWRRALEDVAAGYVWNQSLLDRSEHADLASEVCVVEFQDVYTCPRIYLEALSAQRGSPRLRLRPPYREHLSQSFARFFMRVGLPQSVTFG